MNKNIDKVIEELYEASLLEGSELGDYWSTIISLYEYNTAGMSESLKQTLKKEILDQYEYYKENFIIETREETYTRTIRELVDIGD